MDKNVLKTYLDKFGEEPPMIWGVDEENANYLELVSMAIKINKPLTRDDLARLFYKDMDNNDVSY